MCAFHGAYMEAREQLLGVSSFSAMGSKDASQVVRIMQAFLFTEPSHWPKIHNIC